SHPLLASLSRARSFRWATRGGGMTEVGTLPDICELPDTLSVHSLVLFLENLFATPDQLFRLRRSLPAEKLQCLGFQLVGGREEFFQLFLDFGRQVPNALQLSLAVRIRRDRDDAIIADLLMLGFLYRLQHANELASQHQTRRGRGVMNDHCVDRIAILGSGRWDEAPVVGLGQAEHQRLEQNESRELETECKLRPSPARLFDHDVDEFIPGPGG